MNIALFTDGVFPYVLGGMQKHSFYLAKYLARNKVHVHLFHLANAGKENEAEELNEFSESEKIYITNHLIKWPVADKFPGHYLRQCYQYSENVYHEFISINNIDFVYIQGFAGWKFLEQKKQNKSLPPCGINFHGLEPFQNAPDLKTKLHQILLKSPLMKNLSLADYVFSLGGNLTKILLQEGIAKDKILQIPIGIEQSWISDKELKVNAKRKFVFIGRNERRKGINELNKAIEDGNLNSKAEFHFIGPIPENFQLKRPDVFYYGTLLDIEKIKSVLDQCDVLLLPSYSEGMPTVIIEAMSRGLAVLATDVGAVAELVSEKTGWLIQTSDLKNLRNKIKIVLDEPDEIMLQKKINARIHIANHFIWEKIIRQTIDELNKVISKQTTL